MSRVEKGSNEKQRIDSWKEIAAFFGRDERTVKRWEQSRSLPVHRVPGAGKSGVFAYANELREWLHSAEQEKAASDIAASPIFDSSTIVGPSAIVEPSTQVESGRPPDGPIGNTLDSSIGDPAADLLADPQASPIDHLGSSPVREFSSPLAALPDLHPPASPAASTPPATPTRQQTIRGSVLEMPRMPKTGQLYDDPDPSGFDSPRLSSREPRSREGTVEDRRPVRGDDEVPDYRRLLMWFVMGAIAIVAIFLVVRFFTVSRPASGNLVASSRQAPPAQPGKIQTSDAQAEDFYLKGRYYWNLRTPESLNQAIDAFTQAIVHDPSDAEAYAGLADCYDLMTEYTSMQASEAYPRAIAAATKAVALNDSLSEAHRALGFGLFYGNWEFQRALEEYRRAIQLNPGDVEAHHWYATSLMALGRSQEALAELERARQLDPSSKSILADRALLINALGDHARAISELTELERAEPEFLSPPHYLARTYLDMGNYPAYLLQLRKAALISKSPEDQALADAAERGYAQGGKRGMLEGMRRVQKARYDEGRSSGFEVAYTSVLLGDSEGAIPYLRNAVALRDSRLISMSQGIFADALKNDPRFVELEAQVQSRRQDAPPPRR